MQDRDGDDQDRPDETTIIVSNVLPVKLAKDEATGEWSVSWDLDKMRMGAPILNKERGFRYIGVPDVFVPKAEEGAVERALAEIGCVPVFVEADCAHNHYQGFCKGIIW